MRNIIKGSHTLYDHKYHIVFCTKYRKKILKGELAFRVRDIIRRVCEDFGVEILKGNIRDNHIHLLLSVPPHHAISKIVQHMKGLSSRRLQQEYEEVRRQYIGANIFGL